jgi:hypothetical protein
MPLQALAARITASSRISLMAFENLSILLSTVWRTDVSSRAPIVELENNSWRNVELDCPAALNFVSSGFDAGCLAY